LSTVKVCDISVIISTAGGKKSASIISFIAFFSGEILVLSLHGDALF